MDGSLDTALLVVHLLEGQDEAFLRGMLEEAGCAQGDFDVNTLPETPSACVLALRGEAGEAYEDVVQLLSDEPGVFPVVPDAGAAVVYVPSDADSSVYWDQHKYFDRFLVFEHIV